MSWHRSDADATLVPALTALEPGTRGIPVVVNRTPLYEQLLGADFPLFAAPDLQSLVAAVERARQPETYQLAVARGMAVAARFTLDQGVQILRSLLRTALPPPPRGTNPRTFR